MQRSLFAKNAPVHLMRLKGEIANGAPAAHYHPVMFHARKKLLVALDKEYSSNPFVKVLLDGIEQLLAQHRLTIIQSCSSKWDAANLVDCSASYKFDVTLQKGVIKLSSFPSCRYAGYYNRSLATYFFGKFGYISNYALNDFVATILHESMHAMDIQLLGNNQIISQVEVELDSIDRTGKRMLDLQKILNVEYKSAIHDAFRVALLRDLTALERAPSKSPEQKKIRETFVHLFKNYQNSQIVHDLKSRFIELAMSNVVGPDKIKLFMPETAKWFNEKFAPVVYQKAAEYRAATLRAYYPDFA